VRWQTLLSSPETGASNVRTMYYLSIVCARESIDIANPYFVPDPVAIETLIEAKQRGVDVRIMESGIRNDNWLARHNSARLYNVFRDDVNGCERVTVERWRRRGAWARTQEFVAAFLQEQA
jgi:phosphatidylserine/phosphatidylglycerophosphate/cardiolipin synthase-like enzyme